jgi:hypothetical protein
MMPNVSFLPKKPDATARSDHPDDQPFYAFRTITTLLSLLQSNVEIPNTGHVHEHSKSELKVLDALSALIIQDHGVAAVASIPDDDAPGSFQVLISLRSGVGGQLTLTSQSSVGNILKPFRTLSISLNTRRGVSGHKNPPYDPDQDHAEPTFEPAKVEDSGLEKHIDNPRKLLSEFLKKYWWVWSNTLARFSCLCYRNEKSFGSHIWMLQTLLEHSKKDPSHLQLYVIAACYTKMIIRMTHPASEPFLAALKRLKPEAFEFSEGLKPKKNDLENDLENDCLFFRGVIDDIKRTQDFTNEIPNLLQIGREPHCSNFYTKETCKEFHFLLCSLLDKFGIALEDLKTVATSQKRDTTKVNNCLNAVSDLGSALHLLVRGATIKRHLKVIAGFLPSRADLKERETIRRAVVVDDNDNNNDNDDNDDLYSVYSVHPGQGQPMPEQACHNWLALMVLHFDAVQILVNFVKDAPEPFKLSMKRLSLPAPDRAMLYWKDVLQDPKYFPEPPMGGDLPSTDDITKFLDLKPDLLCTEVVGLVKAVNEISRITDSADGRKKEEKFTEAVDEVIGKVHAIPGFALHITESEIQPIVSKLQSLKDTLSSTVLDSPIQEITNLVEALRREGPFYSFLRKEKSSCITGFSGQLHAEAAAAAAACGCRNKNNKDNVFIVSHRFPCPAGKS